MKIRPLFRRAPRAVAGVLALMVGATLLNALASPAAQAAPVKAVAAPGFQKPMAMPSSASVHQDFSSDTSSPAGPHGADAVPLPKLPSGPDPSTMAPAPGAKTPAPGQELGEWRTESTKTFATDKPGQFLTKTYSQPTHRRDANGQWVDIDTSLAADGHGRVRSASTAVAVDLSTDGADPFLGRIAFDPSHSIDFGLAGAASVPAHVAKGTATFDAIAPATTLSLVARNNGLKEDIVLASPSAPDTFLFPIRLHGLSASIDKDGNILYSDASGAVLARSPHGYMADSRDRAHGDGALSLGVDYSIVSDGQGAQALKVTLDRSWLNDPARVYPVTVDPSYYWNSTTHQDDTYVMSNFVRDNANDADLKVGTYDGGAHVGISFMNFDVSGLNNRVINSARFFVNENWSWSCTARGMGVYRVSQGWDGHTMTTYPGASLADQVAWAAFAMGYSASCPAGWAWWDIQPTVHNWTHGIWGQFGLAMKVDPGSETDNVAWKKFDSWDACGGGSCIPHIDIYWSYLGPNTPDTLSPANGANYTNAAPTTVSARFTDPNSPPLNGQVYFRVRKTDGTYNSEGWSAGVSNGGIASFTPAPMPNGTYTVDAYASNGEGTSGWTAQNTFTVGVSAQVGKKVGAVRSDGSVDCATVSGQTVWSRGQRVPYCITVTNPMNASMSIANVTDILPGGSALQQGVALSGNVAQLATGALCTAVTSPSCSFNGRTLTIGGFTLPAGGSSTFIVNAIAAGDATNCSDWNNQASANNGSVTSYSNTVPVRICDTRLGTENWWSYVNEVVGPQGAASVNVSNGNLVLTQTDATPVQAHGHLAYVLRRSYNSQDQSILTFPGSLGAGWNLNVAGADDTAGAGLGATGLYVPTVESVVEPAAVTLVDRDGTRHIFQPRGLSAGLAVPGLTGALLPSVLRAATGATLCIDQTYTAPAGVHLGLWRYVQVSATGSGACSAANLQASSAVTVGFSAVRPDRLRYEFAATGELLAMVDGSGVVLRYLYENSPSPGVALGRITAVYEPSCAGNVTTAASIPPGCRALRFTYPSATETDVTDPGRSTPTKYLFDTANPKHLTSVVNPDGTTLNYTYGAACGGSANQLCSATDPRGKTTSFAYSPASGQGQPAGSLPVVTGMTDRNGNATSISYTTSTATADSAGHRRRFASIDSAGRVGEIDEGDTANNWSRQTFFTWDSPSSTCRVPGAAVDNNLCQVARKALTTATPDESTTWTYTDEGAPLTQTQAITATTSVTTTSGYRVQYVEGTGAINCLDHTPTGAGAVSQTATTCTARSSSGTLFAVSDRTKALSPRGNVSGATIANFMTTYKVDNTSGMPDTSVASSCGTAAPANTGNLCEVDGPSFDGGAHATVTKLTYDGFGQKATTTTPKATAEVLPGSYGYTYYADSDFDLSGTVSTGGWLKGVTDPSGKLVAFAYDRAGNVARTWDRNATAGHTLSEAWSSASAPPSPTYAETLHGSGSSPYDSPWRYVLSQRDPLANLTTFTVDANGGPTRIRPPRGNAAGNAGFDISQPDFDNNGNLLTRTMPAGSSDGATPGTTRWSYDAFDNKLTQTDPNGNRTAWVYDSVNRLTRTRKPRTTDATQAPVACPSVTGDAAFPNGTFVCTAVLTYDGADNKTAAQDGDGQTSTFVFDGLHRQISQTIPRDATTTMRTDTVYDVDGHAVDICPPREFATGGAGSCTSAGTYSIHHAWDPTGHLSSETTYRGPGSAVTTSFAYDADGNRTSVTDANGHTTAARYDVLDRRTAVDVPRSTGVVNTTTWQYDAAGNTTAVTGPSGADGAARINAYSYDADNRVIDSVAGASNASATQAGLPSSDGGSNVRTRQVYDADGHVVAVYNPRAFLAYGTVTDARTAPNPAFMMRTDLDANGRPVAQWVPRYNALASTLGSSNTQATQCPTGAPGYPVDAGVCVTRVKYDAAGNKVQVDLPTIVESSNRRVNMAYTADNLVASVMAPSPAADGTRVTAAAYVYDGVGRKKRELDALANATLYDYSKDGLLLQVTDPMGHTTKSGYDANGNRVTATDSLNNTTTTTYTPDNRRADVTDPVGDKTSYAYDLAGNVTAVTSPSANARDATNPSGTATVNTYTWDNLLVSATVPVSADGTSSVRRTTYGYDAAGRKTLQQTVTLAASASSPAAACGDQNTQCFSYYPDDRLKTESGRWLGQAITTTYDPAGNRTQVTDNTNSGATITADYYLDDRPRSVNDGSRVTSYSYDGAGHVAARVEGAAVGVGKTAQYLYGDAGLPKFEASDITGATSDPTLTPRWAWRYDSSGRQVQETDPNGQAVTDCWNNDGTLAERILTATVPSTISCPTSGVLVLADWAYTYDANGRIKTQALSQAQGASGQAVTVAGTYSYAYDNAGRLTSFTDQAGARTVNWDHDSNRTDFGVGVEPQPQHFTYNADDTIKTGPAGMNTATFSYDGVGRLASDGCLTYDYDGFDRTLDIIGPAQGLPGCSKVITSYKYDGLDRQRQHKETQGAPVSTSLTTDVHYDGLSSAVAAETPAGAAADTAYVLDAFGSPKAAATVGASPQAQYLAYDGKASVAAVTNGSAAVLCNARFDAFGSAENIGTADRLSVTNPTAQNTCNTGTTVNDVFFKGGRHDAGSGTYQRGSRTYDPTKASFLTPDSYRAAGAGAGLSVGVDPLTRNTYSYVNGDPVNLIDPNGHRPCPDGDCNWAAHPGRQDMYASNAPDPVMEKRVNFALIWGQTMPNSWDKWSARQRTKWAEKHWKPAGWHEANAWSLSAMGTDAGKGFVNGVEGIGNAGLQIATGGEAHIGPTFKEARYRASFKVGEIGGYTAAAIGITAELATSAISEAITGAMMKVSTAMAGAAGTAAVSAATGAGPGNGASAAGAAEGGPGLVDEGVNVIESSGRTFVGTPRGTVYDIPEGWVGRTADNGRGIVFQQPGAMGDADMIRIMEPTAKYPNGYVRYYNDYGQPLDVYGKPGLPSATHIPQDYQGPWPGWPS